MGINYKTPIGYLIDSYIFFINQNKGKGERFCIYGFKMCILGIFLPLQKNFKKMQSFPEQFRSALLYRQRIEIADTLKILTLTSKPFYLYSLLNFYS